ncbi:hypothetical protein [Lacipirellula parvula]|uniref:Uncharacterized protein n=1 Tax=Lacipirellula parvula TaxID=2650471 RepID=A0A5K7XEV8_9BACT|nr:hypothetical protein [Lacipirellula parvula]BBO32866.1 hypothetical protein PLANPX_2478 [Lacipirellula parvula]
MEYIVLAFGLISFFVHVGLAIAVLADAKKIGTDRQSMEIGPMLWGWATLIGGIVAVGIYWFIYHSNLRSDRNEPPR